MLTEPCLFFNIMCGVLANQVGPLFNGGRFAPVLCQEFMFGLTSLNHATQTHAVLTLI